jgi:uncharacterized membrane protein (Fun14 family)
MDVGQSIQAGNWFTLFTYMGFSFFAGYVIGFATRTFLKFVFFIAGTILIVLFLLQYNNLIDVKWEAFENIYNSLIGWISPHLGGLKGFITANLSSAAMASLGLFWGFRRKG